MVSICVPIMTSDISLPSIFIIHSFLFFDNLEYIIYGFPLLSCLSHWLGASLVAQLVKNPPAMQESWVQSLGWESPLEKGTATHSSILTWRIPWTTACGVAKSWTQLSDFHFSYWLLEVVYNFWLTIFRLLNIKCYEYLLPIYNSFLPFYDLFYHTAF